MGGKAAKEKSGVSGILDDLSKGFSPIKKKLLKDVKNSLENPMGVLNVLSDAGESLDSITSAPVRRAVSKGSLSEGLKQLKHGASRGEVLDDTDNWGDIRARDLKRRGLPAAFADDPLSKGMADVVGELALAGAGPAEVLGAVKLGAKGVRAGAKAARGAGESILSANKGFLDDLASSGAMEAGVLNRGKKSELRELLTRMRAEMDGAARVKLPRQMTDDELLIEIKATAADREAAELLEGGSDRVKALSRKENHLNKEASRRFEDWEPTSSNPDVISEGEARGLYDAGAADRGVPDVREGLKKHFEAGDRDSFLEGAKDRFENDREFFEGLRQRGVSKPLKGVSDDIQDLIAPRPTADSSVPVVGARDPEFFDEQLADNLLGGEPDDAIVDALDAVSEASSTVGGKGGISILEDSKTADDIFGMLKLKGNKSVENIKKGEFDLGDVELKKGVSEKEFKDFVEGKVDDLDESLIKKKEAGELAKYKAPKDDPWPGALEREDFLEGKHKYGDPDADVGRQFDRDRFGKAYRLNYDPATKQVKASYKSKSGKPIADKFSKDSGDLAEEGILSDSDMRRYVKEVGDSEDNLVELLLGEGGNVKGSSPEFNIKSALERAEKSGKSSGGSSGKALAGAKLQEARKDFRAEIEDIHADKSLSAKDKKAQIGDIKVEIDRIDAAFDKMAKQKARRGRGYSTEKEAIDAFTPMGRGKNYTSLSDPRRKILEDIEGEIGEGTTLAYSDELSDDMLDTFLSENPKETLSRAIKRGDLKASSVKELDRYGIDVKALGLRKKADLQDAMDIIDKHKYAPGDVKKFVAKYGYDEFLKMKDPRLFHAKLGQRELAGPTKGQRSFLARQGYTDKAISGFSRKKADKLIPRIHPDSQWAPEEVMDRFYDSFKDPKEATKKLLSFEKKSQFNDYLAEKGIDRIDSIEKLKDVVVKDRLKAVAKEAPSAKSSVPASEGQIKVFKKYGVTSKHMEGSTRKEISETIGKLVSHYPSEVKPFFENGGDLVSFMKLKDKAELKSVIAKLKKGKPLKADDAPEFIKKRSEAQRRKVKKDFDDGLVDADNNLTDKGLEEELRMRQTDDVDEVEIPNSIEDIKRMRDELNKKLRNERAKAKRKATKK